MAAGCTISATNDGIIDSLEISTEIPDEVFNRVMLRNKQNWCILGQLRTCQYGRPSSMPLPTSNGLSKEVRIIVESAKNGRKNRPSSYSTFETRYYYMYINTIST